MLTDPCVYISPDKKRAEQTLLQLHPCIDHGAPGEDGLIKGNLGKVLYYAGLYQHYRDEAFAAKAKALLEPVLANIGKGPAHVRPSTALSRGITGLGMVLDLLQDVNMLELNGAVAQYQCGLDAFLCNQSIQQIKALNLDYLHASAGAVNYLTRRIHANPQVSGYLEAIVDALLEVAVADADGIRLRNFGTSGLKDVRIVNFGLAHGTAGLLLVLLNLYEAGIARTTIRHVVEQSLRFVLQYRRHPGELPAYANVFPASVVEGVAWDHPDNYFRYEPFLGWCSSDLGLVLVLHRAAALLGNDEWDHIAAEVGYQTLTRWDRTGTLVPDTFFCHGTAGIAQMYRRLHEASGRGQYLDGYDFWLRETLRRVENGMEHDACARCPGELLFGWTGVGLVLVSALLETDYPWDRLFLLS
jgi:lantibiotic modifying enzyme